MHPQSLRDETHTGSPTRLRCALVVACAAAILLSVHSAPAFGDGGGKPVGLVEDPSTSNPQGSPRNPSTQAVSTGRSYRFAARRELLRGVRRLSDDGWSL